MNTTVLLALVAFAIATYVATTTTYTHASSLALEPLPPPNLNLNGTELNLTADDTDRDISIDPLEPLPANGTVTISTQGATDLDINDFPPVGVAVIIQNDTIMVTNHTFTVGNTLEEDIDEAATESNDDGDNGDSNESDDE